MKESENIMKMIVGSNYASGSLDEPCEMAPLNNFTLQFLSHNYLIEKHFNC